MQPKYLNSLIIFNCRLVRVFKLPVGGGNSIPHKLGFLEISLPQSLVPTCMLILNLMLINLFIIFFYSTCNLFCVAK